MVGILVEWNKAGAAGMHRLVYAHAISINCTPKKVTTRKTLFPLV